MTDETSYDGFAVGAILTKGKKNPFYDQQKKAKWQHDWERQAIRTSWRIVLG